MTDAVSPYKLIKSIYYPILISCLSIIENINLISNDEYGYKPPHRKYSKKSDIINTNRAAVDGIQRTEKRLIDANALREAVINAIVHNDYTHGLSPVIEIYADRIEITSAGGLPAELSEEEFYLRYSAPRNRTLMRIFRDLGYVEHLGNGLRKILSRYDKTVFTITSHLLKVIFRFENEDTIDSACLVGEKAYLNGDKAYFEGGGASLNGDKVYFTIDEALLNGLSQNQDFFSLLLNDDELKREVLGIFADEIYKSLRESESETEEDMFIKQSSPQFAVASEKIEYRK